MPTAWTKPSRVNHGVPVVKTAVFVQGMGGVAGVNVWREIIAARIFPIDSDSSRSGVIPRNSAKAQIDRVAILIVLAPEVLSKPTLLANKHRGVVVAWYSSGYAGPEAGQAVGQKVKQVIELDASIEVGVGRVGHDAGLSLRIQTVLARTILARMSQLELVDVAMPLLFWSIRQSPPRRPVHPACSHRSHMCLPRFLVAAFAAFVQNNAVAVAIALGMPSPPHTPHSSGTLPSQSH